MTHWVMFDVLLKRPPFKGRGLLIGATVLLAACGGGKDDQATAPVREETPTVPMVPEAVPAAPAAAQEQAPADYVPDPAVKPPAKADAGIGQGDKAIPAAIQGRWALKAADCQAKRGTDLTALTIDAKTLRFFEFGGRTRPRPRAQRGPHRRRL